MATFKYTALDQQGRETDGSIDARNRDEALEQLKHRGLYVLDLEAGGVSLKPAELYKLFRKHVSFHRYALVTVADQVMLFRQLTLLLRAGNTLIQSLEICGEMTDKLQLRRMIVDMLVSIQAGSSFAAAIEAQGRRFPTLVSRLVASGEASGELQVTLERLADSLERNASIKRQFLLSMIYPSILVISAVGACLYLALGIIPKFMVALQARAATLPWSTQMMLDVSEWLVEYGVELGIAFTVIVFLMLVFYTTAVGRRVLDRLVLHVPVIGSSIQAASMAQLGWTMSVMLGSGLTVLESLRVTSAILRNDHLSRCVNQVGEFILDGQSLAVGMRQDSIPQMVQYMAGIGERSGELEFVMGELGRYYQHLTELRIKRMIAMIEPAMTVVIGGMVGFVYYAFFSAMIRVTSGQ